MSTKDVLLEQHTSCYDNNNWFVAVKNALDGLTAEQAAWKTGGADNTIWEEVNHLLYWNKRYLQIWRKELSDPQDVDNNGTFVSDDINSFVSDEKNWHATTEDLFRVMADWKAELESATDEQLNAAIAERDQRPWHTAIANQNIHNAYHTGQIVLLRKLQGSWDRTKGVS
jgi:exonuclease V gamma subunit